MSTGGPFMIMASDGKADQLIYAPQLLLTRIKEIMCEKAKRGAQDPTPTLVEIERSHRIPVNAHFAPCVPFGMEYTKVKAQAGNITFGQDINFSIPQTGEFIYDMVLHAVLGQVSATSVTGLPAFPGFIGAADQVVTNSASVSATVGDADTPYTTYTYEYVDASGNVLDRTTASARNQVRYCDFPGERLLRKVKFEVNTNPLDDYEQETVSIYRKKCVAPGKRLGWDRLMGQEVPKEASTTNQTYTGQSVFQAGASNLVDVNGVPARGGAIRTSEVTARERTSVVDGAQTSKDVQPALDLWIPFLFWFCKDVKLAVPSVAIPYGQRFITTTIENQNALVFTAPSSVFLRLTVQSVSNLDGTAAGTDVVGYSKYVTHEPVLLPTSSLGPQSIENFELYINNIYVTPEIHDIYIKRIGFSLIRVHRFQKLVQNTSQNNFQLSQLKWPTEQIYVGFRPQFNVSAANPNQATDWHKYQYQIERKSYRVVHSSGLVATTALDTAAQALLKQQNCWSAEQSLTYFQPLKTIDTLRIEAHGVTLLTQSNTDMAGEFWSTYIPYKYGGWNFVVPEDEGLYTINFSLNPSQYDPEGHFNISRARETYLYYNSSFISQANPTESIIVAIAINFLLVSDGSAILRYTT